MISSETIEQYILSHIDEEPELLQTIRRQAHLSLIHPRMLSGHLQGRILKMFVSMINPQHVLEIGTYTGYSALCIAEGLTEGACLDTIEINDELESKITSWISLSEHKDKIKLHIGDALEIIPKFDYLFNLAFIDGNKRHYIEYYECVLKKITAGGFIIADNTLWDGHVIKDDVSKNDLQTKGIIAFNAHVSQDSRVEKVILPIRDGITILKKK